MKKLFLFSLLFAGTMVFADDAVLIEKFSNITQGSAVASDTWVGDVCTWETTYTRHKQPNWSDANYADFINVNGDADNKMPCCWMSTDGNSQIGSLATSNLEGGIKSVSFLWAQFGSEGKNTLKLKIAAGETEDFSEERAGGDGANRTTGGSLYSHTFANKTNCQLTITNASTKGGNNACRILIGDITITPYLLYTTKEVDFQVTGASNKFTNTDLINNTDEGAVVYSISENTIGATIDAETGEVTATDAGVVTVTASWEGITTSYELTILTKAVATASFDEDAIIAKISESAPVNEFTTNSSATVEFSSSDKNVATVDATGAITLVGIGTTIITANVPENDDFLSAEASYSLRVVPASWKTETFESAEETASNYASSPESTIGDICKWTAQLGGVKHMTDVNYIPMFGDTKYALFRAPRQGEEKVSYIESDSIEGGIEYIKFRANPTAGEGSTTWDIRVFINGEQVGENLSGFPAAPQADWTTVTISNIKVDGKFVIRFENHSIINGTYTSGNKGRLAIDNIEWEGYEAPKYAVTFNAMPEHGLLSVWNGSTPLTSGDEVKAGTTLTIVPTPGDGYKVKSVTVNGDPITPVESVYSCVTTAAPTAIAAEFEKDSSTGIDNMDVNADVRKTVENGIVVIYRNGIRYNLQGQAL